MTSGQRRPIRQRIYLELKRAGKYFDSPLQTLVRIWSGASAKRARNRLVRRRIAIARETCKASPVSAMKDSFMLVRIIGNDLEPRHRKGQSYDNVLFILDHEPAFPDCRKFWIVNRIVDPDEEARIVALLQSRGQNFLRIPFELDAYRQVPWNAGWLTRGETRFSNAEKWPGGQDMGRYETHLRLHKNRYATNSGARNAALDIARGQAKWLMPWDGNCFLTRQAFETIRAAVAARPYLHYVIVPMARVVDNRLLLDRHFEPDAVEEPQIVFRNDTTERFDERYAYGRRPKVEMLWRLGVPGLWDKFRDDSWDLPRPPLAADGGLFQKAGWVARLDSGYSHLESGKHGLRARLATRDKAIIDLLDRCDAQAVAARLDPARLTYYDEDALLAARDSEDAAGRQHLRAAAEQALARGPFTVVDKGEPGPGGDPHDYFQAAPYWWPNPDTPDGRPFIRRDGERVPGTGLYDPASDAYDRTRLQSMLDDTTVLALAATVFGDRRFASHAAGHIRTWFLDPATRMAPHMRYAQVRRGHNDDEGVGLGIIDLKDLYFFLDAVRLLEKAQALDESDKAAFRSWLTSYCEWLDTSPAGRFAFGQLNNHGIFFDLQRAAIAAFLGDGATLARTGLHARERLAEQVAADGALPRELSRARQRHYVLFALQGWMALTRLLSTVGDDLWQYRTGEGGSLAQAVDWAATHVGTLATMPGETFDEERLRPLLDDLARHRRDGSVAEADARAGKLVFHPDCAIPPFWIWRRP